MPQKKSKGLLRQYRLRLLEKLRHSRFLVRQMLRKKHGPNIDIDALHKARAARHKRERGKRAKQARIERARAK